MTMNKVISKILLYGFIILGALVSLFPFYWLAVMATNSSAAFMRFPPVLVFGGQFMTNMTNLLNSIQFGRAMFNTFVVAVCKTAGGVFFCSLASFYFAKFKFPGRRFLFALCLVTMMIPPQLNLIPQLIIMNKLGWLSTFKALILPGLIPAFGIYWMNQYCIGSIHDDLIHSARIDGCGTFGLFLHVGLPIMVPGCAFLCIYIFMDRWNDYLWPTIPGGIPSRWPWPSSRVRTTVRITAWSCAASFWPHCRCSLYSCCSADSLRQISRQAQSNHKMGKMRER